jgi:hypothetical protein
MSGEPYSKEAQLGRGPKKRRGEVKVSASRKEEILARKMGPCRICGGVDKGGNDPHHLVPRGMGQTLGGEWTEANIVPLCRFCHDRVTRRDREACSILRANLLPGKRGGEQGDEESYARMKLGDLFFEEMYPVNYGGV